MKFKTFFLTVFLFVAVSQVSAQNSRVETDVNSQIQPQIEEQLNKINENLTKLSKTVKTFTDDLKSFFEKFSSNQGLRLTERQQLILMAFEVLNRAEQRLLTLQKQKIELTEKISAVRLQLAKITDDLQPESIDRYVSTRGTTNAEQLREIRRQALHKEKVELERLVYDVDNTLDVTSDEIRQTELFIRNIRARIFPQIERELSDL